MHPKGVANITCTNQLQKTMNLQKNETAEDTIWHATSIAHAGHCTNKSAPKMIIILCEAMSLSLSLPLSLSLNLFSNLDICPCVKEQYGFLATKVTKVWRWCAPASGFTVLRQLHIRFTWNSPFQFYNRNIQPSKNYPGEAENGLCFWSVAFANRKQLSSVSDFTTHHWRHEYIATFQRN